MSFNQKTPERERKLTFLKKPDGIWHQWELLKLFNNLEKVTVFECSEYYPEYTVLSGHHTKEEVMEIFPNYAELTVIQTTGMSNMPFIPF